MTQLKKISTQFMLLSLAVVVMSACNADKTEGTGNNYFPEPSTPNPQAGYVVQASQQDTYARQQSLWEQQQAAAKKRTEDSLQEVRQLEKIEAEKNDRMLYAENKIGFIASKLMNAVSPLTGEKLTYYLYKTSVSYNNITKTISFNFNISWYAYVSVFSEKAELHELTGTCTIYGDSNEMIFENLHENQTLQAAKFSSAILDELVNNL
jgi:hypothetical protein